MLKRVVTTTTALLLTVNLAYPALNGASKAAAAAAAGITEVGIQADVVFQTIDNFGASDAWSMDPIGKEWTESGKEQIADLLFSTDKGIGLSGWRFNIGAGSAETDKSIITTPWRRAESFKQTESGSYDWSKQSGQQWFLQAAHDRGVKDLIAFVNSPPVWMTKNGHGQPDSSVGSTNLKAGYEGKFAEFLADVLEHFADQHIPFQYISPINEPTWDWNGANQEGNRYNNTDIIQVINSLYDELQSRNLTVQITAPEAVEVASVLDDEVYAQFMSTTSNSSGAQYTSGSNTAGTGKYREYIKDLMGNPDIASKLANKLDYHSYWSDTVSANGGDRLGELRKLMWQNLQSTLPGASAWMSEYSILGDVGEMNGNGRDLGIDPALIMARTIHYDLSIANASAWQWWTAVSNVDYKDGLIYTDYSMPGDEETIYPAKTLWALGNYSKFIRPGAKRVELTGLAENDPQGLMGSAYVNENSDSITSVYVNYTNEDQTIAVQMSNLPGGGKVYHLTPYVTSASESLQRHDMVIPDESGVFTYTLPARSIVTLEGGYAAADEAPAKPTISSVKGWNKSAEISIADNAGAQSYKIVYGTDAGHLDQAAAPVTGTCCTVSGLVNQTTYYMRVIAVNPNGESEPSDIVAVTPALNPPEEIAVHVADGAAEIQFVGDKNVPHYWAKWGTSSGSYSGQLEISGQSGVFEGEVTGLQNSQTYYLVVEARDGAESSPPSEEQIVVPTIAPPGKLIAIPGDGSMQLEFPAVTGSTGYSLEVTPESGAPTTTELTTNSDKVSQLTNGTRYTFRVKSKGVGGIGQTSISTTASPEAEYLVWEDSFETSSLDRFNQDVSVWELEDGLLKHASGGDNQGELSVKNATMINGAIHATAKHAKLGSDWGVVFRGTDYNHAYSFGFENGALFLRKNGVNLADTQLFSAKLNQLYHMKVVLSGPRIQAYLDDVLMFDVEDATYSSGIVGLHSWDDAQFGYMKVARAANMSIAPEIVSLRPGIHQIDLKYAEVDGATSYTIYYGTSENNLTEQMTGGEGQATVTGLENDQIYYFKVVASDGSQQTESAMQSASPRGIQESQLLYDVDAGDASPSTLEEGEELGLMNSVEEQAYQEDSVTGYKWGYVADDSATWANSGTVRWDSIRQYDGSTNGNGLSYRFEVPSGSYNLTLGFDDPWDSSDRVMDVEVEGETVLTNYVIGSGQDEKRIVGVTVTDGELNVKVVKRGGSKPLISWLQVRHDSGEAAAPTIKRASANNGKVTLYFDETIHASYDIGYGTQQDHLDRHIIVAGDKSYYTIDGLTNGTTYYFGMTTVRGSEVSALSDIVSAAPTGPADPNLYYYIDAGATAVQAGVALGAMQSVPDQSYGADPVTGERWGYVADDGRTWAKSDETDPYLSIRQYDGTETGKGLAYLFDVPRGTYTVQLGFDDPWNSSTRAMDIYIQNERKLQNYVVGDKREIKEFSVDVDSDQLAIKLVKTGSDKPGIGWISVRYDKPLPGSEGPKLWYTFSEGTGTTVGDASGNGHDGTLSGGASWSTASNGAGAVELDGASGYVEMPDGVLTDSADVSVSTNVYIDAASANPFWIFTFGSSLDPTTAAGTKYFGLLTDRGGNTRATISTDRWSAEQNAAKGSALASGVWKNVAVTISGSTMTFYEDGNKIAENTNVTLDPKDIEETIANFIGKPAYPGDRYLKGRVSDFRLYDRALTADEVKTVWMESLTDGEAVQAVKDGLDLGDTTAVITNMTLPTTFPAGVSVTWSSDQEEVLGADGTVTRPVDEDTTVQLIATIKKGGATSTKTFNVTVLQLRDVFALDSEAYTLFYNQTHQTQLIVTHPDGSEENITASATYRSSNPGVATVDAEGEVTGVSAGTAEILVAYSGNTFSVTVTVQNELLVWYKLDETSGTTATDSSGNGHNGTLHNGATWGAGIGSQSSLELGGGYDGAYVQMPNNLLNGVNDLTISAFMKLDSNAAAPQWLATFGNSSNGYLFLAPTLSGRYRYTITPTNWSGESGVASDSIPVDAWRQVAVTYSSATGLATLYVDGAAVGSSSISRKPGSLEPTNANFIGKPWPNYPDSYFKGHISDFRVYRRALSEEELQTIYSSKSDAMFEADNNELALGDLSALTGSIKLPSIGRYGSAISWSSSNEAVINSRTGVVTRPAATAGNASVTLTATITRGEFVTTKTFMATVLKELEDKTKLQLDASSLIIHNVSDVRGNLTLPVKGANGSVITWTTSNAAVVSQTGEVKRPSAGGGDVQVRLTATLQLNGNVLTKAFVALIKELPAAEEYAGYLFAYFIGEGAADGEQLYMATSQRNDPLHWNELNGGEPVFASRLGEQGVRDPFIVRSPDGDKFYMIATDLNIYKNGDWTRAQNSGSRSLLIWESSDLISWSNQRLVEVSSELAGNTWAPEAFYDREKGEYVVFWASKMYEDASKSGSPNERIMYATTRDFYTFTEPKEYINPGYSVIDTTMIEDQGRIYRFTKDERDYHASSSPNGKMVYQEVGNSIFGDFELIAEGIGRGTIPVGEGPLVFKANGEDKWYLFIDYFSGGGYKPFYTTDLASGVWTPVTGDFRMPVPAPRHGTIIPITAAEMERLSDSLPTETEPVEGVTSVTLDRESLSVAPGHSVQLSATVMPADAANKQVLWSTTNAAVATVSDDGVVTGIASGTAIVTATSVDGSKIALAQISVKAENTDTPTIPTTPTSPVTPDENTPGEVKIDSPVMESGTAKVTVDIKALTEAFKQADIARIELPAVVDARSYETLLPVSVLTEERGKHIQIATVYGTVTVPSNMLAEYTDLNADYVAFSISLADASGLNIDAKAVIGERPVIELMVKASGQSIAWNDANAPVLVTIPYSPSAKELANPEFIVIRYMDGSGQMIAVPSGKYNSESGTVSFTTTHFSTYAVAYIHKSFGDLSGFGWAKAAVEVMASKGVIRGTSGTTFAPGKDITRADFIQLLIHTLGLTSDATGQFADIHPDAYYAEAVAVAKQLGIVTGSEGLHFNPETAITRQDAMVMIERAMKAAGLELAGGSERELQDFDDQAAVASYAKQSVAALLKSGIVTGDGSNVNPGGKTTRAETAVLMYRIYNLLP